eukprot:8073675-Lingulodinium_polyedra.AAC.1
MAQDTACHHRPPPGPFSLGLCRLRHDLQLPPSIPGLGQSLAAEGKGLGQILPAVGHFPPGQQ